MGFRLVPKSVTFDELDRPLFFVMLRNSID